MFTTTITILLAAARLIAAQSTGSGPVTGILGNASVVENNPPGVFYTAILPTKEFFNPDDPRGNIKGTVVATANDNGIGVSFQVQFENLPTSGGPFLYHIHAFPVTSDGNCNNTMAHLDPYERGETPACNASLPQTCQVGDLSGKYGKITSDPYIASFVDDFASTVDGLGSFFGNRSLAVHFNNATRITCANFTLTSSSNNSGINNGGVSGGSSSTTSTTTSTSTSTGTSSTTRTLSSTSSTETSATASRVSQTASSTTKGPIQFTGGAAPQPLDQSLQLMAVAGMVFNLLRN